MQEDVLGTRQTVIGAHYDRCTRCGSPTPHEQLSGVVNAGEGEPSAPLLLCSACAQQVALGEPIALSDEHEPVRHGLAGEDNSP